jgi:hypothetical protein
MTSSPGPSLSSSTLGSNSVTLEDEKGSIELEAKNNSNSTLEDEKGLFDIDFNKSTPENVEEEESAGIDFNPGWRLYLAFGTLCVLALVAALNATCLGTGLPVTKTIRRYDSRKKAG